MLYQLSYARTGRPLRFTKDRKDSAQLYRRRVIEHLHDSVGYHNPRWIMVQWSPGAVEDGVYGFTSSHWPLEISCLGVVMTSKSVRQASSPAQIMKIGKTRSLQRGAESAARIGGNKNGRCTNASAHGRRRSSSSSVPGQKVEDYEIQA